MTNVVLKFNFMPITNFVTLIFIWPWFRPLCLGDLYYCYIMSAVQTIAMCVTSVIPCLVSLKAQVSFSDHLSSVCPFVCKLFTFSSSSPEPLGQFQPNLAQSILGWRGFKFIQMKGPALFQVEIITKKWKYVEELKKSSSPEPLSQFKPKLAQSILRWRRFKFFSIERPYPFPRGDNYKIAKIHWQNLKIFFSRTTGSISTKLGTNHPLVKGI